MNSNETALQLQGNAGAENSGTVQQVFTGEELLMRKVTELPTLVEGIIPQRGLFAIVGGSDTGKSTFLRQLAINVVLGTEFLGLKINARHKRAIVVSTEDDDFAISYLLNKQNESLGLAPQDLKGLRYIFNTENLNEELRKKILEQPVDLVILDAFGDLFGAKDMNQNGQVRNFLNDFSQLAIEFDCAIGFLHHTGKGKENEKPSKNNAIGSQGFEAKMRVVGELRLDASEVDLRHFCIVKGNYLPNSEKSSSRVLRFDENMVFHNTGERTSYDNLASEKGSSKSNIITDEKHQSALMEIFTPSDKQLSGRQLNQSIREILDISDNRARGFVDYYEQKRWIDNTSTNKQAFKYKINLDNF